VTSISWAAARVFVQLNANSMTSDALLLLLLLLRRSLLHAVDYKKTAGCFQQILICSA